MKNIYAFLFFCLIGQTVFTQELGLTAIGVYTAGSGDEATEILTYEAFRQSIYVVNSDLNSVQEVSIADPSNPNLVNTIALDSYGASANSIDIANGILAVAVENEDPLANGSIVLFDLDGDFIQSYETGVLPDMVAFNRAGTQLIVANEGEPNDEYTNDPEGSVSIIDISAGADNGTATRLRLNGLGVKQELLDQGVRIFGPGASVAQDLEPEYVAVSEDDKWAFVACQENNAILKVDLENLAIESILPLGYKDYSLEENGIDASDRSENVEIQAWPNVVGMYQPDGMASYMVNGRNYIVTANEGDARDYDGYSEEVRVDDLTLDPTVFPDATTIQEENQLGRLKTTLENGDTDGDGDHDVIYSYGARSFSIFDEDGNLVFDSGNDFVVRLQELEGDDYVKNRSDDKGSEPESITLADIDGKIYAFIGLERQNSFFIYDITNPTSPVYAGYGKREGDVGPEDAVFIPSEDSPTGSNLLVSANEVSGTVTIFEVGKASNGVKIFDEDIVITDYAPLEVVMPPSPLTTQVVFIGGHDIVQTTPTYGNPAGQSIAKEWHDFIGFTPDDSGNSLGWISVNHEQIYRDDKIGDGGGMTVFQVAKAADGNLEVLEQTLEDGRNGQFFNVDFVNTVGETGMNCAGISAPNGRIWTAEEWFRGDNSSISGGVFRGPSRPDSWNPHNPSSSSAGFGVRDTARFVINTPEFPLIDGDTIDKYENFNYMVEIDPKQAVAIRKQYNWGRAGWEGGAITEDGRYAYLGIDGSPAPWVRVTANEAWDFTDVIVEVYKHDNEQGERWIEVPMDEANIFGGLTSYAWTVGATMFIRNEWVTIDQETGIVYWTETGRDSGSSGPGILFDFFTTETNAVIAPHHEALAAERGFATATDNAYQDYYGRVMYYDPASEKVGVVVNGGPYMDASPDIASYPDKHLSNPDGLNILKIDGRNFLMIQEDLNGTSFGRMPEGIDNRLCELFLLPVEAKNASVEELVRVTGVPAGAEITGAIQIDDNTILVNAQHPNANNPFPYNHSLTLAIHGWAGVDVEGLVGENGSETERRIKAGEITREVYFDEVIDCALYNDEYQRIKVFRGVSQISVDDLSSGVYYIITDSSNAIKLIIE